MVSLEFPSTAFPCMGLYEPCWQDSIEVLFEAMEGYVIMVSPTGAGAGSHDFS